MDKIEKIRQEIKRQMKFYDEKEREVLNDPKQFTYALFYQGHQKMCAKFLSLLDTLSGEPDKGLEKAVEGTVHHALNCHYIMTDQKALNDRLRDIPEGTVVNIFICKAEEGQI